MCLITEQKKALIAKEDMKVYKTINENLTSIYFNFQYEIDQLYETVIKQSDEWSSFDLKAGNYLSKHFLGWGTGEHDDKLICIGKGFHSATSIDRLQDFLGYKCSKVLGEGFKIFTCIIPKGSKYYKDATGLIVSNKIIIKGLIEKKNDL